MTEHSTRLVNADALTTQEMKILNISTEPTGQITVRQKAAPHHRETLGSLMGKAFVTVFASTTLFSLLAILVLMTIVPPWYEGLTPSQQAIWCNRVPALCDLQKDVAENDVLAVDNSEIDSDAALSLLNEATPQPTVEPTVTPITPKGSNNISANSPTQAATTATGDPLPTETPVPTAVNLPAAANLNLSRLKWEEQGWNNCGPTTITIGLTFYGYGHDQDKAVAFLKPNLEDKNVSPSEMVAFVNTDANGSVNARALYRIGGTPELLKALVEAEFPVVIERGIDVVGSGWMGHYSLVVGYDDTTGDYLLFDSYFGDGDGRGHREPQDAINAGWHQFNNAFVVLYDPARESQLNTLLGEYVSPDRAAEIALDENKTEASVNPDNKWAWFNMGTALVQLGRYDEAVLAFDRARTLELPFRMLWYQFGPYEAYYNTGRYDDVLALALANERQTPYVEETYYYRGLVNAARGNVEEAIKQFDRALAYNRHFNEAENAKQAVLEGRFTPPS
ncbi:MAG: tetratricopeptide repeat protein [Chloroflexi bacterium]|nr:tetratricopeptide repeat protein [Chloroflexota bacterium]